MFGSITIPFGAKMLFNTVKLKPGVTFDDVELAVGELCSVVKDTYGGDKGGLHRRAGVQIFRLHFRRRLPQRVEGRRATLRHRDVLALIYGPRTIPRRPGLPPYLRQGGVDVL